MQVNTKFGVCRFCLSEGYHKDITREHRDHGEREIYSDIILECFNIFISSSVSGMVLICAQCVSSLRAARLFRELVLRAAEDLTARTRDTVLIEVPKRDPVPVKTEVKAEPRDEIDFVEHDVKEHVEAAVQLKAGLTSGKQKEPPKPNNSKMKRIAPYPCKGNTVMQIGSSARGSPRMIVTRAAAPRAARAYYGCLVCGLVFLQPGALRQHAAGHAVFKLNQRVKGN